MLPILSWRRSNFFAPPQAAAFELQAPPWRSSLAGAVIGILHARDQRAGLDPLALVERQLDAATGKRLRDLPLTPARVKGALAG
jgi:hypothetical protein